MLLHWRGRLFHILTVKLWLKWMTEYNVTYQVWSLYLIILASSVCPPPLPPATTEVIDWVFWSLLCLCEGAPLFTLALSRSQSWTRLVSNGASAHWSGRQSSVPLAVWCAETSLQSCSCKDGHGELLFLLKSQRQVSTKFIRKISRCFFSSGVRQLLFSLVLFKAFGGAAL